jgi:hypothetical protein
MDNNLQDTSAGLRARAAELEKLVDEKRAAYAALDAELQDLHSQLSVFKGLYYSKVGKHLLEKQEFEMALRWKLFLISHTLESPGIEDIDTFRQQFEQQHQAELSGIRNAQNEARDDFELFSKTQGDQTLEDPEYLGKLKALFMKLARACHPDLHHLDPDAEKYNDIMKQVNAYYRGRDLQGLQRIHDGVEFPMGNPGETPEQTIERLEKTAARIDECTDMILEKISAVKQSDLYMLMERTRVQGQGFLDELGAHAQDALRQARRSADQSLDALKTAARRISQSLNI